MNSNLVAALVGGSFALLAAAVGALLGYWLRNRALKDQRLYDEALRQRERLLNEREKLLSLDSDEARAARDQLRRGGELLPLKRFSDQLDYRSSQLVTSDFRHAACFPRGILVLMAEGPWHPIEELQEGDLIKTYSSETQTESWSAVKEVVTGAKRRIIRINNIISATPEQQIFCDGWFQPAAGLRLGGVLVSDQHQPVTVTSTELITTEEEVYSIALNEDAGYFIKDPQAQYSILVREAITGKTIARLPPLDLPAQEDEPGPHEPSD